MLHQMWAQIDNEWNKIRKKQLKLVWWHFFIIVGETNVSVELPARKLNMISVFSNINVLGFVFQYTSMVLLIF